MRAPKLKKFAKKARAKIGTRHQRVATRQRRKTSVVTAKQKGKRARKAERARTKAMKGTRNGWLQEKLAQDQAGAFEDVSIAFDPETGDMMQDWSAGGAMESGYGAMVEPITEKAWFWPAIVGSVAAIYFFTMKKK